MNDKLKILIVGGSGMIGYKLANFLSKQGYEICSTYNKNIINDLNSIFLDVVDSFISGNKKICLEISNRWKKNF